MKTFSTEAPPKGEALAGRLVIVTGASSGIGYGTARRLALAEGARVIAVARRRVFRIEALAAQIEEQAGEPRVFPLTVDMADRKQAEALVTGAEEKFGRIDGFIHAVNRALKLSALEVSDREFDLTMQVNVKSALYGVQAAAPLLRRSGAGGIVIYNPTPQETAGFAASEAVYTAAAHALSALCGGWARQLDGSGVGVREVAPPPGEDAGASAWGKSGSTHDALLVSALREALCQPAPPPARSPLFPFRPSADARPPQTLRAHGGLVLKDFS